MCLFAASDITTSFPASGKFTEKQKIIYNAVLDANLTVFREAKPGKGWSVCEREREREREEGKRERERGEGISVIPGVRYTEMHKLSEKVILTHLKAAGLVHGDVSAQFVFVSTFFFQICEFCALFIY